jgi:ABC-type multidrug transport system fused ATPase/permease subunit
MRFHRPTSGEILIDGQPAHTFRTATLRQHIGVVDQHTFLFNASVRHNIAYGTPSASQQQVVEAARVAGAHDFIVQLPEGYDTPIGDSGALLSGGQRQRISIARAVLLQPDLLILDEATSALDTESEALVRQSLQNLIVGRTALIIAHRLSTVAAAQLIVVLEGGRIVERGTHQELLQLGGRYSQLVKNSTLLN